MTATLLATKRVEKPWGRHRLYPGFPDPAPGGEPIGEVWFQSPHPEEPELLIKYLFTSEKLSIQVHPSNAQARAMGLDSGKEECWLVLDAEPDARLGIGTKRALTDDELREASLNGEIEALMDWKPVQRGDFFYIPAGTVHAIGAGVSLIEIQQNADITFRLYDYGRPRELHLEGGVAVSDAKPYASETHRRVDFSVDQMLVDGPLFRVRLCGAQGCEQSGALDGTGPQIVIPVQGSVTITSGGQGDFAALTVSAGECLAMDPQTAFSASPNARLLLARAV